MARSIFHNNGTATLTDLRVRFRIQGYSTGWSPWKRTRFVYPTQTVIETYFPILSSSIRTLHSDTPAMVEMEYSYRTPDGRTVEDSDAKRTSILGLNQVMFSSLPQDECTNWLESFNYSPLIGATFVTNVDPIVTQYAGMAAKMAGGVAASTSDDNALKFMKAVYDLMVANGIKYQSPPGLLEKGVVRQHVKFGRDVLQNHAGTCIDLAILYASTCQAGGLDPGLIMIPGHCFPYVKLPSGAPVAVEATAVSGDEQGREIPFQKAAQIGTKELAQAIQSGALYIVDIKKLRAMGVPTPELPDLPPSTLNDWGIRLADQPAQQRGPAPQWADQRQNNNANLPQPPDDDNRNLPQPPDDNNRNLPQPPDNNDQYQPSVAQGGMKQIEAQDSSFTFSVPGNWQAQAQAQGGGEAAVAGDQAAGVTVMCKAVPINSASLRQLADGMIQQWEQSVPGWRTLEEQSGNVSGKPAIVVRATGNPPNNPPMYAEYIFVMGQSNQYLLGMQCPQQAVQQYQGLFRQIAASWQVR